MHMNINAFRRSHHFQIDRHETFLLRIIVLLHHTFAYCILLRNSQYVNIHASAMVVHHHPLHSSLTKYSKRINMQMECCNITTTDLRLCFVYFFSFFPCVQSISSEIEAAGNDRHEEPRNASYHKLWLEGAKNIKMDILYGKQNGYILLLQMKKNHPMKSENDFSSKLEHKQRFFVFMQKRSHSFFFISYVGASERQIMMCFLEMMNK